LRGACNRHQSDSEMKGDRRQIANSTGCPLTGNRPLTLHEAITA
jgi:hypothetical protein